ncbi:FecR family protein [Halosquirtibacter xylanolyticus]|uniref:FecR family protein n=1 Tax=Halosquirtibacter xylanolyticus TaxID=3374599 RepID=UPI0037499D59|nr:FecR family protein [Prolixibacteraceae bacterium]
MRREKEISWRLFRKANRQDLSKKEKEAFDNWAKKPQHQSFFDSATSFYQEKEMEEEIDVDRGFQSFIQQVESSNRKSRWKSFAVAASILLAITTGSLKWYSSNYSEGDHTSVVAEIDLQRPYLILEDGTKVALKDTVQLPKGLFEIKSDRLVVTDISAQWFVSDKHYSLVVPRKQSYCVELADGTVVTMNAASKLTFPNIFDEDSRQVSVKGEAFFKVSKQENKPFYVRTSDVYVKVLGTQFNVNTRNQNHTVVILTEGKVEAVHQKSQQKVSITPDMLASFHDGKWTTQKHINAQRLLAWRGDAFSYENNTLEEIFKDLSYWYDFKVKYSNKETKKLKFTGTFERYNHFQDIVRLFQTMGIIIEFKEGIYEIKEKQ